MCLFTQFGPRDTVNTFTFTKPTQKSGIQLTLTSV